MHLFEIHDQEWFPRGLRDAVTDTLRMMFGIGRVYENVLPRFMLALKRSGSTQVLDLCSGGGGAWTNLRGTLDAGGSESPKICLSDKFPNAAAFEKAKARSKSVIDFVAEPVDATDIPAKLDGFRSFFTAFHHFSPKQARAILADAVAHNRGIAIFEAPGRSILAVLFAFLMPIVSVGLAPFIRPLTWSRLFWTYVIPVVPFVLCFDGIVSCLRVYSRRELREFVDGIGADHYHWEIGEDASGPVPVPVTYLIGYPINPKHAEPEVCDSPAWAAPRETRQPAGDLGVATPVATTLCTPLLQEAIERA